MLLIGAGLLARGSQRAFGVDLGFDYRNMIVVQFPRGSRLDPAKMMADAAPASEAHRGTAGSEAG